MREPDPIRDLHEFQALIDRARRERAHYEFWVSRAGRDVYGVRLQNGLAWVCGPLSYQDIENTDHLSEFQFVQLSEREFDDFEKSTTLNLSRANMCVNNPPKKRKRRH